VASALLKVHRVLIGAAIALSLVLIVWGVVHGARRGEDAGWFALGLGAVALLLLSLYMVKVVRNPPIR
jgi:hypothetical protein